MRKTIDQFFVFFKNLKKKQVAVLVPLLFLIFNLAYSQPGTLIEISGQVTDQEKNLPLSDVSVQVKGNLTGTITNSTGNFLLRTKTKLPLTLVFSSIGSEGGKRRY